LLRDYHLLSFDSLDSTNEEAKRLAQAGAKSGAIIWARSQTQGRGRQGRVWESQDGNLYVTFLLAASEPIAKLAELSFVAALAVADTVRPLLPSGGDLRCKWPNDIYLNGKKLAGILLESLETQNPEASKKRWVIVGIGINVENCPESLKESATCLKQCGVEIISAKIVLARLIDDFFRWHGIWREQGFAVLREKWLAQAYGMGKAARVVTPQQEWSGKFTGLGESGEMLLQQKDGTVTPLTAGEVFFSR
jgi:BirA family biotin operon repressor/biotin-[acetyl-CoA-carboxylase] ligase